ncbi:cytochrome c oxidase subunit 4 [Aestuariimicrobium sp. p3-SID1156]|uniref:cytochrome c oxidase subunit 4 n=1 Tax=Aestuariimicrobium sp. p3-SID1156 TaxID=2916038 RepID=UPI00223BEBA6|nr:cytochrome c oxidase subunit 4 [Aestuariimicrobium sp. p3-SID1156]MCT1458856.1 cytochrome c oxidase subunit 4 [Aestuariimicrobium sp. p3-SID1156]
MKSEKTIFGALGIYFLIVGAAYYFLTEELVGTVALILTAVMSFIITTYLAVAGKQTGRRLEDDVDAEIYQGAGELGFFPPQSIWPLWVALTIGVICLGPVFGWWLTLAGIGMGLWSVTGWVMQFYRGDYAH